MEKTNVMRILSQNKINYISHSYANTNAISGMEVANVLNQNPNMVFKTLVTKSNDNKIYVFVVPVNKELDLKKASKCVNKKCIEMVKSSALLTLTGYIHGGCSPIGMKKNYPIVFDESALNYETIMFSAGKIGYQVEVNLNDLNKLINFKTENITKD